MAKGKQSSPSKKKKYPLQFAITEQNRIRKQKKHKRFMEKKAEAKILTNK